VSSRAEIATFVMPYYGSPRNHESLRDLPYRQDVDGMQRKARSLHQRCSERRVRCGQRSESAFHCIGHVANAPFTAQGGAARASDDASHKIIGEFGLS
jgi:hypothetical protein